LHRRLRSYERRLGCDHWRSPHHKILFWRRAFLYRLRSTSNARFAVGGDHEHNAVCVVTHCDERRAGIDPQLRGRRRRLIFLILLLVFLLILDELLFPLVLDVVENVAVGQV
jgi:hypothetical protein